MPFRGRGGKTQENRSAGGFHIFILLHRTHEGRVCMCEVGGSEKVLQCCSDVYASGINNPQAVFQMFTLYVLSTFFHH